FNPLPPLRMAVALEDPESRWAWTQRVMAACWGEGQDVSSRETLLALARQLNLEVEPLWKRAHSPAVKAALQQNTQEAVERGIFGVSSFWVEEELFWGNDRLEFLKLFLQGRLPPTDQRIEELLGRPSSAKR